jgi:hypothetical protein
MIGLAVCARSGNFTMSIPLGPDGDIASSLAGIAFLSLVSSSS